MKKIQSNGRTIEISNHDKLIFPDEGLTKLDVVNYYRKISNHILPHLEDRPLSMHRYPDGINEGDFFQKDTPDYFPDWIDTIEVALKQGGTRHMVNVRDEATLLYLAGQALVTPHIWLSKRQGLQQPYRLIFDLDAAEDRFDSVQQAALAIKDILEKLEIACFAMASGSKGMHIIVPLDGKGDFEASREFARHLAQHLEKEHPDRFTTETRKDQRKGRLFIDYLRNGYGL
jgi:bifunctional non-homologous end joining protein LigD